MYICDLGHLITVTKVWSCLLFWNRFRDFVQSFARVGMVLNAKLRKAQQPILDRLTKDDIIALEMPESKLVALVLGLPRSLSDYIVVMDPWNDVIVCILLQSAAGRNRNILRVYVTFVTRCQTGMWHSTPRTPFSRMGSFTALALFGVVLVFCPHWSWVAQISNLMDSTGKVGCWWQRLAVLGYDSIHCISMRHQTGDAYSRLRRLKSDQTPIEDDILVLCITAFI